MMISNALVVKSRSDWIVDSGATCHMCNDSGVFSELKQSSGDKVALGNGSSLDVTGEGKVELDMLLDDGTRRGCSLMKVLYVPELAYNLVSVARATEAGKDVQFDDFSCKFQNESGETIALGKRHGSLYFLELAKPQESVSVAQSSKENKERLWHRRFGHLNEQSMQKLVKRQLVNRLDYDVSRELGICEACIGGKPVSSQARE